MIGDLRNAQAIEVARAKGGYLDTIPPDWIGSPLIRLEPKLDDVRMTLQFDEGHNWAISRNREDKLKGVDKAGPFVDWSSKLPHLCAELDIPELRGLMLDGGISCGDHEQGRGASVATYMKECPRKLVYTAWDILFRPGTHDVRDWHDRLRRDKLEEVIPIIQARCPSVRIIPRHPATQAKIEEFWSAGWEGVILKNTESPYRGTNAWRKCKAANPIDAFILAPCPEKKGGSPKAGIKPTPTGRCKGFLLGMKSRATGKVVKVGWMIWNLPERDIEFGVKSFDREYKGRVVCATGSGWDGSAFRWLRFKSWRDDEPGGAKVCFVEDQVGGIPVAAGVEEA